MSESYGLTSRERFTSQAFWKRVFTHGETTRVLILIALIAAMAGASGGMTFSARNAWNILATSSIKGIATVGQFFAMRVGGLDLSLRDAILFSMGVGGVLMSGTISTAGIAVQEQLPIPLGILLIFAINIGWSVAGGALWTRAGIPALIVGLALWQVANGANIGFIGGRAVLGLPEGLSAAGQGMIAGQVPITFVIFVIVCLVSFYILHYTPFGRAMHAVGGHEVNAYLSGVNVKNTRLKAYIALGIMMALASSLFISQSMSVSTRSIPDLHFDTISAVFIGGMTIGGSGGTLVGTIIGVLILGVISNGISLLGLPNEFALTIKGTILIVAVAVAYMRRPKE